MSHLPGRYLYCAWQRLGGHSKVSQSLLRLGYDGPRFSLEDDRDDDCITSSGLTRPNLLLQSAHSELKPGLNIFHIKYLCLQGQYHLILPSNGMQDRFLGHVWFFQMGPTLELPPNTP